MPIDYRTIFEGSPDGILVVDSRGVIVRANLRAATMFGIEQDDLQGSSVERLVPPRVREQHVTHRERFIGDPHMRPMGVGMELRAVRADGTEFPVEISLSPLEMPEGALTVATIRDVTQHKRLRDFGTGALRASEEERARIARELHDDTAQELATALVRLRLIQRTLDGDARRGLEEIREALQATADGVRRIARGLRPPELEDAGLPAALRSHIRALEEARGLRVHLDVEPVDRFLTPDGKLVLYRIVQEALSNVARHAGTDEAWIRISEAEGVITVEVEDRGVGFSPQGVQTRGGGLGLLGMQERAVMMGGRVTVTSRPGQGTLVSVRVPVELESEVERV